MESSADSFINFLDPYINKLLDFLPISWADNLAFFHPYIVIFAVSLPLVAIGFQISKKADLNKAGTTLYTLGIIAIVLAFLSGKSSYIDVRGNISSEGLELLNSHATAGMIVLLSYIGILLLKLLNLALKKDSVKNIITLLMFFGGGVVIYLMISGIKLVFHYGAGLIL